MNTVKVGPCCIIVKVKYLHAAETTNPQNHSHHALHLQLSQRQATEKPTLVLGHLRS